MKIIRYEAACNFIVFRIFNAMVVFTVFLITKEVGQFLKAHSSYHLCVNLRINMCQMLFINVVNSDVHRIISYIFSTLIKVKVQNDIQSLSSV